MTKESFLLPLGAWLSPGPLEKASSTSPVPSRLLPSCAFQICPLNPIASMQAPPGAQSVQLKSWASPQQPGT